jgi:hypothetical protein
MPINSHEPSDSLVRCGVCGRELTVSFAFCTRNGWPKCHGATMRLETRPSEETIDKAVDGIFGNARRQMKPTDANLVGIETVIADGAKSQRVRLWHVAVGNKTACGRPIVGREQERNERATLEQWNMLGVDNPLCARCVPDPESMLRSPARKR